MKNTHSSCVKSMHGTFCVPGGPGSTEDKVDPLQFGGKGFSSHLYSLHLLYVQ